MTSKILWFLWAVAVVAAFSWAMAGGPLEQPLQITTSLNLTPFTPQQQEALKSYTASLQSIIARQNRYTFEAIRGLSESSTGDTLVQHVFDTCIGGTETFTFPVAYTSISSYRVSCIFSIGYSATNGTINKNSSSSDQLWRNVRVNHLSSSTINIENVSFMGTDGIGYTPTNNDTVTCECVAAGN